MSTQSIVVPYEEIMASRDPSNYTTRNRMTIYEKTTILGVRMEQLSHGAPSTLPFERVKELMGNVWKVAEEELAQGVIPLMICRTLPDQTKEYWRVEELTLPLV